MTALPAPSAERYLPSDEINSKDAQLIDEFRNCPKQGDKVTIEDCAYSVVRVRYTKRAVFVTLKTLTRFRRPGVGHFRSLVYHRTGSPPVSNPVRYSEPGETPL